MPSFSAKEFVSVQPMSVPAGAVFYMDYVYGDIIIIFDEELWWEEDAEGNWYCPQTERDHRINDFQWKDQRDNWLVIPQWEVDQMMEYKDGMGNEQVKSFGQYPLSKIPLTVPGTLQKPSKTAKGKMYPKNMSYGSE